MTAAGVGRARTSLSAKTGERTSSGRPILAEEGEPDPSAVFEWNADWLRHEPTPATIGPESIVAMTAATQTTAIESAPSKMNTTRAAESSLL